MKQRNAGAAIVLYTTKRNHDRHIQVLRLLMAIISVASPIRDRPVVWHSTLVQVFLFVPFDNELVVALLSLECHN